MKVVMDGRNAALEMRKLLLLLKYLGLYYVSGTLILFAFSKICGAQFQEVHFVNYIPLGELSNRQLAWAFFGRSYAYTLFLGLFEFLAAVLMLPERTRLAGLLLAFGIYVNIVLVDLDYDVNDAIQHATIELIIVLIWLVGYLKDQRSTLWDGTRSPVKNKPRTPERFGVYLPIAFILCSSVYSLHRFHARFGPPDKIIGAYKVTELSVDLERVDLGQGEYTKAPMFFFEFNRDVVLSARDSTYQGSYTVDGDSVLLSFDQEFKGVRSVKALVHAEGQMEGLTNMGQRIKVRMERMEE